ncbi:MAG: ester cyclase [Alphaproteobacteria bacterium]|nr:ester cyclase [Alphaproteobacteria bacterium]
MTDVPTLNKAALSDLFAALYNFDSETARARLKDRVASGAPMRLSFPFETMDGAADYFGAALSPLSAAFPDLERRQTILIAGPGPDGAQWVGSCGCYTGVFARPFLDIPPTGHQASLRFHEFFRMEDERIVEMQALWDLPELMMQSGSWPMSATLGREWHVPGPATCDGLVPGPYDAERSRASCVLVGEMLDALGCYAEGGVEAMRLGEYWHPRMSWYGPSGIGTCRGIDGFRRWHQAPFLRGMPDRRGFSSGRGNLFGDGDYVGYTKWPGMSATITGDGWLGIAPAGREVTMRSLDFWRREGGLIRENWVLVDLLDVYDQIGVDVLGRMRELSSAPGDN